MCSLYEKKKRLPWLLCEKQVEGGHEWKVKVVTVQTKDIGGTGDRENRAFLWKKNGEG